MADNNIRTELKIAKNRKILIVLLLAVVMMIAAAFSVYYALSPSRTTIFVFDQNYSAGTQVTREMLIGIQIDSSLIIGGASVPIGDRYVTGSNLNSVLQTASILRTDVYSGTAIMSSMLTTTGGNAIEQRMRQNAIAITIPATNVTGVTSELSYGSRVNVYASYNAETILLLQNMRVLRVTRGSGGLASVTLEVDVEESLKLVHAEVYGTVHLGIVDAHGYQYTTEEHPTYNITGFTVPADIYYQSGAQQGNNNTGQGSLQVGAEDDDGIEVESDYEEYGTFDEEDEAADQRNPAEIFINPNN